MKSLPSFQNKIKTNQWGHKYLEAGEITIRYGSKEHIALDDEFQDLGEQNSLLKQEIKKLERINDHLVKFIMSQNKKEKK